MTKNKQIKIKIPDDEYVAMFESKVSKFSTGGHINALKRYIGKDVIVLVKKEKDLVGMDGSFNKMDID